MPGPKTGIVTFALITFVLASNANAVEFQTPAGWLFSIAGKDELMKFQPEEYGLLNETGPNPKLYTTKVLVRKAPGVSARSATAKLTKLESEMRTYANSSSSGDFKKPSYEQKKLFEDRPTIEWEIRSKDKSTRWIFGTVAGDTVVIFSAVPRNGKAPPNQRRKFFDEMRAIEIVP